MRQLMMFTNSIEMTTLQAFITMCYGCERTVLWIED